MAKKTLVGLVIVMAVLAMIGCTQPMGANYISKDSTSKVLLGEGKQIVAYFTDWSTNHTAMNDYRVKYVPFDKLTIINFAFTSINDNVKSQFNDFKNYTQTKFGRTVQKYDVAWLDKDADVDQTFEDPSIEWGGEYTGVLGQLKYYKEQYPHLKVVFSVGGWTKGHMFSEMAASDTARAQFVSSCVAFAREYGLDGVDIDWEYPGIDRAPDTGNIYDWGCPGDPAIDGDNYTKLVRDLKIAFNAAELEDGKEYLVTSAVGVGYSKVALTTPADYIPHLDYLNLMTYDMHGAWDTYTGHQCPIKPDLTGPFGPDKNAKFNIEYAIDNFYNLGVPKSKMNLGLPYYSRGWAGVEVGDDATLPGLYETATGGAPGVWEAGGLNPYSHMKELINTTALTAYYDPVGKASFAYDAAKKEWYTYDSLAVIQEKANLIMSEGLAGGMVWEIDGDTWADGSYELTNAIFDILYPNGAVVPTPVPPTATPTLGAGEYPTWSASESYDENDIVTHNGSLWIARWGTTNEEPGVQTWYSWIAYEDPGTTPTPTATATNTPVPATATPTPAGPTATPTATPVGPTATPTATFTATPTNTPTNTPTATPTTGGSGPEAWAPSVTYAANDLVTYSGSTYKCLTGHTSLVGWEPPNVPSLWQLQ